MELFNFLFQTTNSHKNIVYKKLVHNYVSEQGKNVPKLWKKQKSYSSVFASENFVIFSH